MRVGCDNDASELRQLQSPLDHLEDPIIIDIFRSIASFVCEEDDVDENEYLLVALSGDCKAPLYY